MENEYTIFVKENFNYHFASMYFDMFRSIVIIDDDEFKRLFKQLQDYIDSKICIPCAGEFVDFGVYVERKIKPDANLS